MDDEEVVDVSAEAPCIGLDEFAKVRGLPTITECPGFEEGGASLSADTRFYLDRQSSASSRDEIDCD